MTHLSTRIHVVTDNDKFFESLHVNQEKGAFALSFNKYMAGFQPKKKIAPPPAPFFQFIKEDCLPNFENSRDKVTDIIVVEKQVGHEVLKKLIVSENRSVGFIICAENDEEAAKLSKQYRKFATVDVVSKSDCQDSFTWLIFSSVLKQALIEAGFL